MLHESNLLRRGPALLTLLLGMLLPLLVPTAAHALSRPDVTLQGDHVRLVRGADGTLSVHRGPAFHQPDGVVVAEGPDVTLRTQLVDAAGLIDGLVDDTLRPEQWALDELAAEQAWTVADGADQVIAVLDSGVDGTHPDLGGQLVDGISLVDGDELVDQHGHGTHVAGIAAARAGNAHGVAGLAPAARIMPVQVTNARGLAYASDVAEGLLWAVDHGASVANLSLAGPTSSAVLDAAIRHAVDNGVLVVAAAGNRYDDGNPVTYPAAKPDVLAVGATRSSLTRSSFSSTGDFVGLAAPGSVIMSTRPGGGFAYASGTSMAAPLVAAAAALLRSVDPTLTVAEVSSTLTSTAVDIGEPGRDDAFGHGLVDVVAALEAVGTTPAELHDVTDLSPSSGDSTSAADPITGTISDGSWVAAGWDVAS